MSKSNLRKIAIIFLSISLNICFGCSKEPSHGDGSFEYLQHMFWLRNKKNNFQLHTLILLACIGLQINTTFECKIVNILLPISFDIFLSAQKNRHIEPVLLSTRNICLGSEIRIVFYLGGGLMMQ